MSKKDIFLKVKKILVDQLHVGEDTITGKSVLTQDLGADSLDVAEIALMIKEQFNYDITDAEMQKINTVDDICDILDAGVTKESLDAGTRIHD